MPLITTDILKIYQRYGGDSDGLARDGSESEIKWFGGGKNSPWYLIASAEQDMDLIAKGLASKEFAEKALSQLKENCDEYAFKTLTGRIPFYAEFQNIADIISLIKQKIKLDTDITYTRFNNVAEAEITLSTNIKGLRLCNFDSLKESTVYFGPTGTYQELAIHNNWRDEYMALATQFDFLKDAIYKNRFSKYTHR